MKFKKIRIKHPYIVDAWTLSSSRLCAFLLLPLVVLLAGCTSCGSKEATTESREAKNLLQGIWADDDTQTAVFKMHGDSVYYPDTTSMPAFFRVVNDSLYIGTNTSYYIQKQTEHVLWIRSDNGETVKLVKLEQSEFEEASIVFEQSHPQAQTLTEVVKNDTVVFYENRRYHLYVAINPTRYQVVRHTLNDDGIDVENVFFDNIIHLSIFEGSRQLFSRDFRKHVFQNRMSPDMLSQVILTNMEFDRADAQGFHLLASLCVPGSASCYQAEIVVAYNGKLTIAKE